MAMVKLVRFGALALLLSGPAWAQQTTPSADNGGQVPALVPRSHEERESRYRAAHRVILNALVTDRSGKPVTGLKADDFTVLDNGKPQKLAAFRAVAGSEGIAPVRVILMLDAVNNSPKDLAGDHKGVERFLRQSPRNLAYPTSIGILTGAGTTVSEPSRDSDAVIGELSRLTRTVHLYDCSDTGGGSDQVFATINVKTGSTIAEGQRPDEKTGCQNERFHHSVSALKKLVVAQENEQGRAILIWIGRGWPLLLSREFRDDTPGVKQNQFDNLVLISNALREAQVTLDSVFSPDLFRHVELRSDHDNRLFNGVPTEREMTASSLGLQMLGHQSGGLVLIDGKDLAAEIGMCVQDAESYYALSFDTAPAAPPNEFHSLEVKTNDPSLTVRTNTDYYAEP